MGAIFRKLAHFDQMADDFFANRYIPTILCIFQLINNVIIVYPSLLINQNKRTYLQAINNLDFFRAVSNEIFKRTVLYLRNIKSMWSVHTFAGRQVDNRFVIWIHLFDNYFTILVTRRLCLNVPDRALSSEV